MVDLNVEWCTEDVMKTVLEGRLQSHGGSARDLSAIGCVREFRRALNTKGGIVGARSVLSDAIVVRGSDLTAKFCASRVTEAPQPFVS